MVEQSFIYSKLIRVWKSVNLCIMCSRCYVLMHQKGIFWSTLGRNNVLSILGLCQNIGIGLLEALPVDTAPHNCTQGSYAWAIAATLSLIKLFNKSNPEPSMRLTVNSKYKVDVLNDLASPFFGVQPLPLLPIGNLLTEGIGLNRRQWGYYRPQPKLLWTN